MRAIARYKTLDAESGRVARPRRLGIHRGSGPAFWKVSNIDPPRRNAAGAILRIRFSTKGAKAMKTGRTAAGLGELQFCLTTRRPRGKMRASIWDW